MRIMWRAWGLGALVAAGLVLSNGTLSASDAPVVHVSAVVKDGAVRLEAEANGPFEYTTYRPSAGLYVVDLSGVSAGDPAGARVVASDLVKSYRVTSYSVGNKPMVRVEVLLGQGLDPHVERKDNDELALMVSRTGDSASSAVAAPVPVAEKPVIVPAASKVSDSKPATLAISAPATPVIAPVAAKASDVKSAKPNFESIRQVNLTRNEGQTEVNISGSGPLTYQSIRLHNPDRLVLDFSGSHLTAQENHIASNLDPVREVRLAQFSPEVSRVVIDLREEAVYDIKNDGNIVTVAFAAKPAAPKNAEIPGTESAAAVTTKRAPAMKTAVPAPATPAAAPVAEMSRPVPVPTTILPVNLTQPSAELATPAKQQELTPSTNLAEEAVSAPAATPASSEVAAPASTMTSTAVVESSAPVAQPPAAMAPVAQAPAPAPSTNGKYTGEPISVNLKDVDLRDFFRLIHEISGLNVVVDPAVKGNLTIVLDDVPWDQALDIVLHNNDLDKQLDGNVLRIATRDTLKKEAEESRDLSKAQAEAADVVTTTRVLSYAKATLLSTTLKKFLSSRGDIIADDRSNTLIIRDIPSTLPVLDNLIRQLDRRSQQVEIEARVVAANRSFSREIGTQFGISTAFTTGGGVSGISGSPTVGASPTSFTPAPPVIIGTSSTAGAQIPQLTNLSTGSPTSGFQYLFQSKNFALDFIIDAAEDRGVGKLLSKPKVITQNNEQATVKQGTKIPVSTIVNNTVSVQFVDAVLELDVTPQITADGTVYMDVTVENDQIDASIPRVQGIPAIDTQSASTKVTVSDGATVVIGGIIVNQQRTDIQQVPLVGSIPMLGNLFKHTTISSTSQELLFFLTPRILPS